MRLAGCSSMDSTELLAPHGRNMSAPSQGFGNAGTKGCPCSSPGCCGLSHCKVPNPILVANATGCQQLTLGFPGGFPSAEGLGSLVKEGPVEQMQNLILFVQWRMGGARWGCN